MLDKTGPIEKYGTKLNRNKCEQISINGTIGDKIKFLDGTTIKKLDEVKYIECMINDKADKADPTKISQQQKFLNACLH